MYTRACVFASQDPKLFSDMDALREHLQNEGRESPGFISGLINWVSGASFGQAGLEQVCALVYVCPYRGIADS